MKKFKRISALILAAMISLTLVSCGGDEESSANSKAESAAPSEAASEATSETTSDATSEEASAEASEAASEEASEEISEEASEEVSEDEPVDSDRPVAKAVYGTPKVDVVDIDPLWANVPEYKGEKIRYTAGTDSDQVIYDTYTRFTFKLMWDETHLYILEKVTDLTIGDFNTDKTWQNDSTEIAISLNASNATTYDFAYDGWIGLAPHELPYWSGVGESDIFGTDREFIEFCANYDKTGYVICASFDIESMNSDIAWEVGHMFGLEISVNDSVEPGTRANCIAWADDTDRSYQNPSLMGLVYLVQNANDEIGA